MLRHKYHRDRVYHLMGEPGPGSIAVGYVRYSSEMQDSGYYCNAETSDY